MSMTVTERQHFAKSIEKRMDQGIARLMLERPDYQTKTVEKAKANILERAKAADKIKRYKAKVEKTKKQLEELKDERATIIGLLVDRPKDEILKDYQYNARDCERLFDLESAIDNALGNKMQVEMDSVMEKDQHGKKILALRREKAMVTDAVWLATSTGKMTVLWERVLAVLGELPQGLEQLALEAGKQNP